MSHLVDKKNGHFIKWFKRYNEQHQSLAFTLRDKQNEWSIHNFH